MRKVRIDMAGLRYGRLVGIEFAHSHGGRAHWLFECDCGNRTIACGSAVRAGTTTSCGCFHREISATRLTTHGHRARKRHPATYRAWQEINTFCTNAASPRYRDFGGRGIRVCSEWREDFTRFLDNMGERPAGTILVRIDASAHFAPGNCRWAPVRSRSQRAMAAHRRAQQGSATRAEDPIRRLRAAMPLEERQPQTA